MPLVLFRSAENSFLKAEQLVKQNNAAGEADVRRGGDQYDEVVKRYPEFERINRARYGWRLCYTAQENWDKAAETLETIPAAERSGDLAGAVHSRRLSDPNCSRESRGCARG